MKGRSTRCRSIAPGQVQDVIGAEVRVSAGTAGYLLGHGLESLPMQAGFPPKLGQPDWTILDVKLDVATRVEVRLLADGLRNSDLSVFIATHGFSVWKIDAWLTSPYQKRRNVEGFRPSTKSNTGLARPPTHTVRTQRKHFFASIHAIFKVEKLKLKHPMNHFALRSKLYTHARQASIAELQRLTV